jgi:2-dehydro-3-deoxy-D-arabinonate dehydratase
MVDLIDRAEAEGVGLGDLASQLASRHAENLPPVLAIHPREVWGCGCTYQDSDGTEGSQDAAGDLDYLRQHERPEIYLKGTTRVCVGPGKTTGIRADSTYAVPGPELALVLGSRGRIVGYTIANNFSARDLERESPFYRPQARSYQCSCALGPAIVTADQLPDPHQLEITCTIKRDGKLLYSGNASTAGLRRRLDVLIAYLLRSNPVPAGSVLLTGSGILVPQDAALLAGDVVTVRIPEIGDLVNRVETV